MGNRDLPPFRTGNVIRDPSGSLWVVTDCDERVVHAVAFDAENVSATQRLDDEDKERFCNCGDHPEFMGEPQEDCERCHGTGTYVYHFVGWRRSKLLAPHVEALILRVELELLEGESK